MDWKNQLPELPKTLLKKWKLIDIEVFQPISRPMIFWYLFVMIILLTDLFITIYIICFHGHVSEYISKYILLPVLLLIFVIDFFVTLNTGFISNGRIIKNRPYIYGRYFRSKQFFIDIITLAVVVYQFSASQILELNYFVFLRMIRIKDFDYYIRKYAIQSSTYLMIYHIVKHLILLIMVCHIAGSFYFYLDIKLIEAQWYPKEKLWIYNSYAHTKIIEFTPFWQYTYSFYFAVVTLSGVAYGDLTPLNPTQTLYTMICLLIPLLFYSYIFSMMYEVISKKRQKKKEEKKFKRISRKYLKQSGLSESKIEQYINYLTNAHNKKSDIDNKFVKSMAPKIKDSYMRATLEEFKFTIFFPLLTDRVHLSDIQNMVMKTCLEEVYPMKQQINPQKSKVIKLYYLSIGQIYEFIQIRTQKFSKQVKQKTFFCHHSFYTGIITQHSNHIFETIRPTVLQAIPLHSFIEEIKPFQLLFQSYHTLRQSLLFKGVFSQIQASCFFCEDSTHIINTCDKLRHRVQIAKLLEESRGRESIRRNGRRVKKIIKVLTPLQILAKKAFLKKQFNFRIDQGAQTETKIQKGRRATQRGLEKIESVWRWSIFQSHHNLD